MKKKRTVGSHLSGPFLLTSSPVRRRMSVCISLFTLAIPVNYTSEFGGHFEVTTCVCVCVCVFLHVRQQAVVTLCIVSGLQGRS